MSTEDEEILQDFILEVGEILEQMSEQLVDLEQRPGDADLLNSIFRGFHTVKGGAGFLHLDAMVETCHATETLFGVLRSGKRNVTAELMDVVLQALDMVSTQFAEVSERSELTPAPASLIKKLELLADAKEIEGSNESKVERDLEKDSDVNIFKNSKDSDKGESVEGDKQKIGKVPNVIVRPSSEFIESAEKEISENESDEISEEEFEALLDKLHGSGRAQNFSKDKKTSNEKQLNKDELAKTNSIKDVGSKGKSGSDPLLSVSDQNADTSDLVTDDEFEDLLDQLHGKGRGPTKVETQIPTVDARDGNSELAKGYRQSKDNSSSGNNDNDELFTDAKGLHIVEVSQAKATNPPSPPTPVPNSKSPEKPPSAAHQQVSETTVRVDTQRLDIIMNMVGELVLVRNRLVRLGERTSEDAMQRAIANLDVVTADLQSAVMKTRMQPIKKVFGRFPRLVRDLARSLKKEINLELRGEETDLDKNLVEALADPLIHLVRNSVDHGIEFPADREAKGKSRSGKISLSAEQEGDHILLTIIDDGQGMNPEIIKRKAIEKGVIDAEVASRMSDSETYDLIFSPGFSTNDEITNLSGRGVGMDVVKSKIGQLNGSIKIESKVGEGTEIAIRVPLTLAIMPTLMIMLNNQIFALPLTAVNEIYRLDLAKSHNVDGQQCVTIREKAIPIFCLNRWLGKKTATKNTLPVKVNTDPISHEEHVVIVSVGTQKVGLVVDKLIGQEEVVIKPLGKMLHGTPGMAGATITGDGTIALIIDIPSMLEKYSKIA